MLEIAVFAKPAVGWLMKKFGTEVISRWTNYRAHAFIETFVAEVAKTEKAGGSVKGLEPLLEEIVKDKVKSELLFEAYRKVSLSASKEIGPRVIAVITARLVAESREATQDEEQMMWVAETFNDGELRGMSHFLASENSARAAHMNFIPKTKKAAVEIRCTSGLLILASK